MTGVAELIDLATAAGLELIPVGEKLRIRGPEPLPGALVDALREHKIEVLALLSSECERDPLPPVGDPRRPVFELIDDAWAAGCYVVAAGGAASIQPRRGGAVPGALCARLRALEGGVVKALMRRP